MSQAKYYSDIMACPPEMFSDNSDDEYGFSISKKNENKSIANEILLDLDPKIKIIPNCGFEAGLFKNNFDISLDEHSQEWFNKIHEYWKQCKLKITLIKSLQQLLFILLFVFYLQTKNVLF